MFHPLNLEQQHQYLARDIQQLQRSKRVRPEDIDLPQFANINPLDPNSAEYATYSAASDPSQTYVNYSHVDSKKEDEKLLKRKKFLFAQLKFSKKLAPSVPKKLKAEDDMEMSD